MKGAFERQAALVANFERDHWLYSIIEHIKPPTNQVAPMLIADQAASTDAPDRPMNYVRSESRASSNPLADVRVALERPPIWFLHLIFASPDQGRPDGGSNIGLDDGPDGAILSRVGDR